MTTKAKIRLAKSTLSIVERVRTDYFKWLCGFVTIGQGAVNLEPFLWSLHEKEFHSSIQRDENRAEDGRKLRDQFAEETLNEDCDCLNGPCTILELLIGLAFRMDFQLQDSNNQNKVEKFFWEMIKNLGLEVFDDCGPEEEDRKKYLNEGILYRFIQRDYSPSGRGGLFPLRRPTNDQRGIEIWYQMMAYIKENYAV